MRRIVRGATMLLLSSLAVTPHALADAALPSGTELAHWRTRCSEVLKRESTTLLGDSAYQGAVKRNDVSLAPGGSVELHASVTWPGCVGSSCRQRSLGVDLTLTPRARPSSTPGKWTAQDRIIAIAAARLHFTRQGRVTDGRIDFTSVSGELGAAEIARWQSVSDRCFE